MTWPRPSLLASLWPALIVVSQAVAALAQPYARFDVPDSAMVGALAGARADYENAWNALLVAELRASLAKADSARKLVTLSERIAAAETEALGSRIAPDALAARTRWKPAQQRLRIRAAVEESLATVSRNARAFEDADRHYAQALTAYRSLGEKRREAWVVGGMAANALIARQLARAESLYVESLALRRALGDPRLLGNTLNDLGQVYFQLGRLEEAHRYLNQSYAVRSATGQQAALWNTLSFLALTKSALGQPDSAAYFFDASLQLTVAQGDSARTLSVLSNLAMLLMDHDDPRSLAVGERALTIAREREDLVVQGRLHNNLANFLRRGGHYTDAIERFQLALELQEDPAERVLVLNGLASACLQLGDPERAGAWLDRAMALADTVDDPSLRSLVLVNRALASGDRGDRAGAMRHGASALEQAMAAGDSARVHDACEALGTLAVDAGDPAAGQRWLERARAAGELLDPERRVTDIVNLANARHVQGDLNAAEGDYRRALPMARAANLADVAVWSMTNLGDIAERRGDFAEAFSRYGTAAAMIDSARGRQGERESIKLYARGLIVHEAMIHLMGKLDRVHPDSGYAERAYALAERARSRSLLDRLRAAGNQISEPTLTLAQARELLRSDREALLEYSAGDSSTSLWVIRRSGWKHFMLPSRHALRPRIQALRRGLADPLASAAPAVRTAQHSLYQALVADAEPFLSGVERIVVIPDGILSLAPFEALLVRPTSGEPQPRDYLLNRWAVSYAPSATALAARGAATAGTGPIVALADPWFGPEGASATPGTDGVESPPALAALPSSAGEVDALRRLAGKRPVSALTGREATRERLLAALPGADVIHIATHGDVNEAEPERSGLWLAAADSAASRRLEAADVLALRLDAGLVTLSACETGLGRVERGEGVVGLARAFLASGARSVVVSLWRVNDRSTAELMRRFYAEALRGKKDRDAALTDAKRALLASAETRSPYYWAPFILIGESGRLQ